jgi:hypothetical protein
MYPIQFQSFLVLLNPPNDIIQDKVERKYQ